jgi:hypothetical protein
VATQADAVPSAGVRESSGNAGASGSGSSSGFASGSSASGKAGRQIPLFFTGRSFEWALVAAVLLVLIGVFLREFQKVQAYAERASVKTTLGALRIAIVVDYVQAQTAGVQPQTTPTVTSAQHTAVKNPFLLLAQPPKVSTPTETAAFESSVPAGFWVFEATCRCIGYRPQHEHGRAALGRSGMVWFNLVHHGSGPNQLVAQEAYEWNGELLN